MKLFVSETRTFNNIAQLQKHLSTLDAKIGDALWKYGLAAEATNRGEVVIYYKLQFEGEDEKGAK